MGVVTKPPKQNPSITADCGNLVVGKSYCVEALNEPAPAPSTTTTTTTSSSTSLTSSTSTTISTSTSTTTTKAAVTTTSTPTTLKTSTTTTITQPATIPSNGITTPSPAQPSIVSNCDKFYLVKAGDTCDVITQSQAAPVCGPTPMPACPSSVTNPLFRLAATTTKAGNGIATPTPIQPNMVANCDSFYKVKSGDTCDVIAAKSGISSAQIISSNASVGSGCTQPAATTTTNTGNGIATPTSIQSGMTTSCKTFHFVSSGQTCVTIVAKYKITLANFVKWNPAVGGTACTGLWANTYACVAVL
ncbi:hypothetical protein QBC32DRAFT_371120 [Pseudoneurospora amorphoporcata]|uniref:LysM domain-containing protein n=1 Tax=Pseudoneurospora amorphoporcata TaxID=241081 RepID=A0AAN6SF80_9PEZI|nr:hypothetical protein QBC32DRAFT_371120 [Pseudoneurospora amorphoporcata]